LAAHLLSNLTRQATRRSTRRLPTPHGRPAKPAEGMG
ncbi:MAG: hypothetical protein QOE54_2240, partial [Streptosporangiaceae bacterium]|nr:hypothetical protein [Streptosporangiaceae bacterium]